MEHTLVAVDLAKLWFEVALSKEPGKVCKQLRLKRENVSVRRAGILEGRAGRAP
jgi:hypothetical protein